MDDELEIVDFDEFWIVGEDSLNDYIDKYDRGEENNNG